MDYLRPAYLYLKITLGNILRIFDYFWFGESTAGVRADFNSDYAFFYLIERQKIENASKYFKIALQLNPKHSYSLAGLAIICLIKRRLQEAADHINKAIELNPEPSSLFSAVQFMIYRSLGKKEIENKALKPIYELFKNDLSRVYEYLSYNYGDFGLYEDAEYYLKKAIEEQPNEALLHYNFGALYFRQKKYPEARDEFAKVIELQKEEKDKNIKRSARGYLKDSIYYIEVKKKELQDNT